MSKITALNLHFSDEYGCIFVNVTGGRRNGLATTELCTRQNFNANDIDKRASQRKKSGATLQLVVATFADKTKTVSSLVVFF